MQVLQQLGGAGRRAGDGAKPDDALLPPVVGGEDGRQVADEEGDQPEPDRRLDEGDPDAARPVRLGEPQRRERGAADLERLLPDESEPVPQNTKVKATTIRSIQTSGRLTRATGAYSARNALARDSLRHRCTRSRYTSAKTAWDRRGKPPWGRTTVFSAEPRMESTRTVPRSRDRMWRAVMVWRRAWVRPIAGTLAGAPARGSTCAGACEPARPAVAQEISCAASWTALSTSFLSTSSSLVTFFCAFSSAFST